MCEILNIDPGRDSEVQKHKLVGAKVCLCVIN